MQFARTGADPRLAASGTGNGRLVALLAIAAAVSTLAALPVRSGIVVGRSMEPTLHSGQPFLYRPHRAGETLHRGKVVVVRLQGRPAVKRIFALGGDTFWSVRMGPDVAPDCFLIDPDASVAVWRKRFPLFRYARRRVPEGTVYVVGDGVSSVDSRTLGPVDTAEVMGEVYLADGDPDSGERRVGYGWHLPPPSRGRAARRPRTAGAVAAYRSLTTRHVDEARAVPTRDELGVN